VSGLLSEDVLEGCLNHSKRIVMIREYTKLTEVHCSVEC
jgi:hypothetical protein